MACRIGMIFVSLCLTALPTQAWQGNPSNKPIAELEQMSESDLALEALSACLSSTSTNAAGESADSIKKEELQYITMISRFARKKNRGTTPWWAISMYEAAQAGDSDRCQAIWQVVEQASNAEAKGKAQKRQK